MQAVGLLSLEAQALYPVQQPGGSLVIRLYRKPQKTNEDLLDPDEVEYASLDIVCRLQVGRTRMEWLTSGGVDAWGSPG